MSSNRYKKLPQKTKELPAELIEKLIPELKKNCTSKFDDLDFPAKPRWQLDESAAFLKGAGIKI